LLPVGSVAPEIDAETSTGARFRLSEQQGLCTVVYFFPKAFTPGCTRETATFRDNYAELRLARAELVGVSTDDLATQCSFASSLAAPFPMIGDKGGAISKAFDVTWPLLGVAKRVTYVIGPGRVIVSVFRHELLIGRHRDDVLGTVDALYRGRHTPSTGQTG
jgi:peroxiredoxin Q/BCP